LKIMSWKPYPKISQAPKLRSQVLKTMSWKPYPKISRPGPACPSRSWNQDRHLDGQTDTPKISRPGLVRPSRSWNQDRHLDGQTDG
jgi:hypothetical protein